MEFSGGLSSVSTDNVTLQGNGQAASPIKIKAVQVDGVTITGAGTVASPLVGASGSPAGWPLTFYASSNVGTGEVLAFATVANTLDLWGIFIPAAVKFNKIYIQVQTPDGGNLYDVGIYTKAGVLVAHAGAGAIASGGITAFTMIGGPITLNPGSYYLALTGNATTATYIYINAQGNWSFQASQAQGASSGGVLPGTITPPADSIESIFGPQFALSI